MMKKLAVIGASYLQQPLIEKAKQMGIQTHVFAWKTGDIGEKEADFFYPVSIVEKDKILDICRKIGIDGICSIASDLAMVTVNYVANEMGLIGNSNACTYLSTNKYAMRRRFEQKGDPSPKSICVKSKEDINLKNLKYPIIVKPVDRSGSRGVRKVDHLDGLEQAIDEAVKAGFVKQVLIEEYVEGQEYSVECISWQGKHYFLAVTKKYTSGSPRFIETAHLESADINKELSGYVQKIVFHALDSLQIEYGASHTELKIDNGKITIIEIGGRMGGDFIGSDLVELTTGIDFLQLVIKAALGEKPDVEKITGERPAAGIRFILSLKDIEVLRLIKKKHPEYVVREEIHELSDIEIKDSSNRFGYYILCAADEKEILHYLES